MTKVLVTDGHWRKTLAVVRSLGRKGIHVTVGERTFLNTSFFSKYCSRRIVYPSPRLNPERFMEFLLKELSQNRYDCLFPMEEETLMVVAKYASEISKWTSLLIPDLSKIEFVRDKANLIQFAERHGIPTPTTFYPSPSSSNAMTFKIENGLHIPIPSVIKPRVSSGSFGIVYVNKKEDLLSSYQKVHQRYPFPLIQEYIPDGGGTYGFCALFDHRSNLKAAFVHKKLRMYPVRGGPSTLRESVRHPQILELGLSLLRLLNWRGVAMVEFKVDPRDETPKLMELNPRFWGSLQLAIFAGVDFPYLMLRIA
ncbi:MAG: ATP-grasp domain-containing protein, partial [Thermodesulfobacteriota bacterium]